ncbi:MAG: division/cell wall cluster transcriptional repressor MraZ [Pseudomonadales bacterium]|jgi:MraZ protein|nr:division/cell wall cluster transcriptional repressor MraZ [Pseudomonadales bacterium]
MFIGSYYNKLEGKGRLTLPKVYRQVSSDFTLTRGLDGQLFLFKSSDFQGELEKLNALSYFKANNRQVVRFLAGNAVNLTVDKLGRLNVPDFLLEAAGIKKDVVIVGNGARIEIWDQVKYHQLLDNLTLQVADLAEQIDLD